MSTTIPISKQEDHVAGSDQLANQVHTRSEVGAFLKSAIFFMVVGLVLYLGVYAVAETLNYSFAKRNRFFMVNTAPQQNYDFVILGASHAAALDYEDMTQQLEQMTNSDILNLSNVGSGITVNRLVMDYFLRAHTTDHVIYFIDSFAFNSTRWNEERLQDVALYNRAPFDVALIQTLWQEPAGRSILLDYAVGFSKINNQDRFEPDITNDEATRWTKVYRPIKQIDKQRLEYLYPGPVDTAAQAKYLAEFDSWLQGMKAQNISVTVIKPPVPERWYNELPHEAEFDATLKTILDRNGVRFYDFSLVDNEDKFFYNTDHLNRDGVLNFFQNHLSDLLK